MTTHVLKVRMLYKTISKLHRGLPKEMQELGSNYVREEFKRHKKCNAAEAAVFMTEWTNYAITLAKQLGLKGIKSRHKSIGVQLSDGDLEKLRSEQIYQLYELMQATKAPRSGQS